MMMDQINNVYYAIIGVVHVQIVFHVIVVTLKIIIDTYLLILVYVSVKIDIFSKTHKISNVLVVIIHVKLVIIHLFVLHAHKQDNLIQVHACVNKNFMTKYLLPNASPVIIHARIVISYQNVMPVNHNIIGFLILILYFVAVM